MAKLSISICYLLILFIILFFTYTSLEKLKYNIKNNNDILIKTENNLYGLDKDECSSYFINLKEDIIILYKNIDKSKYPFLEKYLDNVLKVLQNFIKSINKNMSTNINEVDKELQLQRYKLISKYDLLDNDDDNNNNKSRVDDKILNLILNIENLLVIINNSSCKNKQLSIIEIKQLLDILLECGMQNRDKLEEKISTPSTIENFTNMDLNLNDDEIILYKKEHKPRLVPSRFHEESNDRYESMDNFINKTEMDNYVYTLPKSYNSQFFTSSNLNMINSKSLPIHTTKSDMNKTVREKL